MMEPEIKAEAPQTRKLRSDAGQPRGPRKSRTPNKPAAPKPEALQALHHTVTLAVGAISALVLPSYAKPTQQEIDDIFKPCERIYLRRYNVPEINPDTQDAIAAGIGVLGYVSRVAASRPERESRGGQPSSFSDFARRKSPTAPPRPAPRPAPAGNGRTDTAASAPAVSGSPEEQLASLWAQAARAGTGDAPKPSDPVPAVPASVPNGE